MKPSTAKNLIKELGNFFDWLDGAKEYEWVAPRRFHDIKKSPDDLHPPRGLGAADGPGETGDPR